eukprot:m.27225 g.27225  ORF g.27225 m.27225 type:complete len:784 (+) comp4386_c0_seq1:76-2427(+)
MPSADEEAIAALVTRLKSIVRPDTRALLKGKAKDFARVCSDVKRGERTCKIVCCAVIVNSPTDCLRSIQQDLWRCLQRWLEDALPPGKKDDVVDKDDMIREIVKGMRKLKGMWMHSDGGKYFGKVLLRLTTKSSNKSLKALAEKVGDELTDMHSAKEHIAEDDETPLQIAEQYGVDVDELVDLNGRYTGISRSAKLEEGTIIKLPKRAQMPKKEKSSSTAVPSRSTASVAGSAASSVPKSAAAPLRATAAPVRSSTLSTPSVSTASSQSRPKTAAFSTPSTSSTAPLARAGKQPARPTVSTSSAPPKVKKIVKDTGPSSKGSILSQLPQQASSRLSRRPSQDNRAGKRPMPAPSTTKAAAPPSAQSRSSGSSSSATGSTTGGGPALASAGTGTASHPPGSAPPTSVGAASSHLNKARGEKITLIDPSGPEPAQELAVARKRSAGENASPTLQPPPKRAKKSVRWGDGWSVVSHRGGESWRGKDANGLVHIRYIEPRDKGRGGPQNNRDMKAWEKGDERQHFGHVRKEVPWPSPLLPFVFPESDTEDEYLDPSKRGTDSEERMRQEVRERTVLRAQYFAEGIPPSATEPDEADSKPDDHAPPPIQIPLVFSSAPPSRSVPPVQGGAGTALARDMLGDDALASLVRDLVDRPEVRAIIEQTGAAMPSATPGAPIGSYRARGAPPPLSRSMGGHEYEGSGTQPRTYEAYDHAAATTDPHYDPHYPMSRGHSSRAGGSGGGSAWGVGHSERGPSRPTEDYDYDARYRHGGRGSSMYGRDERAGEYRR